MIPGVHPPGGVADGWMGWGLAWVCWGCLMHACTHAHAHTTCMLNMLNMDASMLAAICNFYTCINVRVCMCVHVHACACMCMCVGTLPYVPRCPPPTCPLPRAAGSPKHQNSISPELIEIIQFCLKILYL